MIHFKIGAKRQIDATLDEMNRPWVGWEPNMSPRTIYKANRGTWVLGARADGQRFAVFSDTLTHTVRCAVEIESIENTGGKRAIVGRVLEPGHPFHDAVVGKVAPDNNRNPVTYHPDPDDEGICACGCAEQLPAPGKSAFLPGHDQRAIHTRIAAHWGTTLDFVRWCDEQGPQRAGRELAQAG